MSMSIHTCFFMDNCYYPLMIIKPFFKIQPISFLIASLFLASQAHAFDGSFNNTVVNDVLWDGNSSDPILNNTTVTGSVSAMNPGPIWSLNSYGASGVYNYSFNNGSVINNVNMLNSYGTVNSASIDTIDMESSEFVLNKGMVNQLTATTNTYVELKVNPLYNCATEGGGCVPTPYTRAEVATLNLINSGLETYDSSFIDVLNITTDSTRFDYDVPGYADIYDNSHINTINSNTLGTVMVKYGNSSINRIYLNDNASVGTINANGEQYIDINSNSHVNSLLATNVFNSDSYGIVTSNNASIDTFISDNSTSAVYGDSRIHQATLSNHSILDISERGHVDTLRLDTTSRLNFVYYGTSMGDPDVNQGTIGGIDNNTALTLWSDIIGSSEIVTYGADSIGTSALTLDGNGSYVGPSIQANNATQTALELAGSYWNLDLSDIDNTYINDNTSTTSIENINLFSIANNATALHVSANNSIINNNRANEGWDVGQTRISGSNNTLILNNAAYDGTVQLDAMATHNVVRLDNFLQTSLHSDNNTNRIDMYNGTYALGQNGFTPPATPIINTISGSWDQIYIQNATLTDYQAGGALIYDTDMFMNLSAMTLNRQTDGSTPSSFSIRNLEGYDSTINIGHAAASPTTTINVQNYSGDMSINGMMLGLNSSTTDALVIHNMFTDSSTLHIGIITDGGVGSAGQTFQFLQTPNDSDRNNETVLLSGDATLNGDGTYTLLNSPYAWNFVASATGYALVNTQSGQATYLPSVNQSIVLPIVAINFVGSNASQSIDKYLHNNTLDVRHANDIWGQYVYQKEEQHVYNTLGYTSTVKGFDIGRDLWNTPQSLGGVAFHYRGVDTVLQPDNVNLQSTSMAMDATLVSVYGTYKAYPDSPWSFDGQVYWGRATGHSNNEEGQTTQKGTLIGGYAQLNYQWNTAWRSWMGTSLHQASWKNTSFTSGDAHNQDVTVGASWMYPLDDAYTLTISPRYRYILSQPTTVAIAHTTDNVALTHSRDSLGLNVMIRKEDKDGSSYISISNDRLQHGGKTNVTIGGTWTF